MAGIAAVRGAENGELGQILEKLSHRGPHGAWTGENNGAKVGCLELYVGGQSRKDSHYACNGQRMAVIDGRIYNSDDPAQSDAEALLAIYDRYGPKFASMLDGDFACAVLDGRDLYVARDCTGVKPLYYGHSADGSLLFSSETKGLLGLATDVREFPPGYTYSQDLGFRQFSCDAVQTPEFEDYDQAKVVVRDLLCKAVEKRMKKDNAIGGVLLSGGLDSSLISYMAAQIKPDIECFTVSMEDGQDLPLAKDVTRYLGLKHHILIFGKDDISAILPHAIYHQEMYEEDCVHGAIANYLAAGFVKTHTTCVLTGEGADEFFAGYDGQFRKGRTHEELASIVDLLTRNAHNTGLQRLDRLNAAHGIESRTPFLDPAVIDFAMKIPLQYKVHGEERTGKWVLRQAFEGCLPDHLIYQTKRFFAQGSGVAWIMRAEAEKHFSEQDLRTHNATPGNPCLSTVEELYYYQMFKQTFKDPSYDRLVARWDPLRPDFYRRQAGC